MLEELCRIIAEQFSVSVESVTAETAFVDDLSADSIDLVELSMTLEDQFGLGEMSEEDIAKIVTVGDLEKYIQDHQDI